MDFEFFNEVISDLNELEKNQLSDAIEIIDEIKESKFENLKLQSYNSLKVLILNL